jgi:hypothetical protein
MKYFKIENKKVLFSVDTENWFQIDEITKDYLMQLLELAINSDFEMDEYEESLIANPAHQIIYKNIHEKFEELLNNKKRFKDESDSKYKEAFEKYQDETP